jgi:gliding motility-associated-like protein
MQFEKWLYVVDTGNKCFKESLQIIDLANFSVPDRHIFYDGDTGEMIYDSHEVGSNCNWYGTPGAICRAGFFIRRYDGSIEELDAAPDDYILDDSLYNPIWFKPEMGYRVEILTSARNILIEVFPNYNYYTIFHMFIHPTIHYGSSSPDVIYRKEYVCDLDLVGFDTLNYGYPCDSIVFIEYIYDNSVESIGLNLDTTILYGSNPFIYQAPDWLNDVVIDGDSTDSIIIYANHNETHNIWGCTKNDCCGYGVLNITVYDNSTFIPNIFSPNGDGYNDIFKFYTKSSVLRFEWHIFDRWGQLIYMGKSNWDGGDFNPGVYVYTLYIEYYDKESQFFSGDVTLIK